MRGIGFSVLAATLCGFISAPGTASAAGKGKKAGGKGKAAVVAPPQASVDETNKLKGDFKWEMTPEDVLAKAVEKIQASYEPRLNKTAKDPAVQDRVRKSMRADIQKLKKNAIVKFDGPKTGYDVSIVDQEFGQEVGESMLVSKEDNSDRYFFFSGERLYKMFIAFDKDMLQGKSFQEFGKLMQTRFGKAKEVYAEEKSKKGVTRKLDHYLWSTKSGDMLRLVDRSAFYGVYCLVIYDARVAENQADARKARLKTEGPDALVEAVTSGGDNGRDSNDNVIDRITGRTVYKPGEAPQAEDIVVPSPTSAYAAPPIEANRPPPPLSSEPTEGSKVGKPAAAKPGKGRTSETSGLEL